MAAVLCLGLYLRLANLGAVQHFQGDQGRDYLEVMRWLQDGHWPLVGPQRITGDYTLGPGWYYTLAPALALSGFNPAAGAATMAVLGILAAWLAGEWVRRTTRSRLAALAVTAAYSFSAHWVFEGRTLWNPHPLPLGVVAMAWLIQRLRRRPGTATAAGVAALLALLPQWHTTGLLVVLAALPALAPEAWRAWKNRKRRFAETGRRWAVIWAATAGFAALLYVPPLLYELQPGHASNLKQYFSRTAIAGAPDAAPVSERALLAFNRLALGAFRHAFDYPAFFESPPRRSEALLALRALTLALAVALARRVWRRRLEPSVAFLALLAAGYGALLLLKGATVQDYFMIALHPAPLLLVGWLAGILRRAPRGPARRQGLRRTAGAALALALLALALGQLPRAWSAHTAPGADLGGGLALERQVAAWIARDSGGRPYSLQLARFANTSAHYLYLARWLGRPARNTDYMSHSVSRAELGERLYVIDEADPGALNPLAAQGLAERVAEFGGAAVYRIEASRLPPSVAAVGLRYGERGPWILQFGF